MKDEIQHFRDYLKKQGLKNTPQREGILACLLKSKKHLAPEEIFEDLRKRDPRIGRATVFRTLKLLEKSGLAAHVTFADGRTKFEWQHGRPHHDHMICVECGKTLEFSSPKIEQIQDRIADRKKFKILWHRHEIFGKCARCQ